VGLDFLEPTEERGFVAPLGQAPLCDRAKTANTLICTAILHSYYVAHKCGEVAILLKSAALMSTAKVSK
jgi:hypothetical protein